MVPFAQSRSRPRGRFLSERGQAFLVNLVAQAAIVGLGLVFVAATWRELTHG